MAAKHLSVDQHGRIPHDGAEVQQNPPADPGPGDGEVPAVEHLRTDLRRLPNT